MRFAPLKLVISPLLSADVNDQRPRHVAAGSCPRVDHHRSETGFDDGGTFHDPARRQRLEAANLGVDPPAGAEIDRPIGEPVARWARPHAADIRRADSAMDRRAPAHGLYGRMWIADREDLLMRFVEILDDALHV